MRAPTNVGERRLGGHLEVTWILLGRFSLRSRFACDRLTVNASEPEHGRTRTRSNQNTVEPELGRTRTWSNQNTGGLA